MKSDRIIIVLLLIVIGFFLALVGRCFYLQYLKGEHYYQLCIRQQESFNSQKPQRGAILDCRGRVLAASNRVRIVFADPRLLDDFKDTSNQLAPILNIPAHEICKLITDSRTPGYVKIKAGATIQQCSDAGKIYGIGVQYDWQRHYPMGRLAAHAVGFTSIDNQGLDGLEFQFNKELTGSEAQSIFLADVRRRPICLKEQTGVVTNGLGIISTLDATIQQFARAELKKQYESYEAESAVAIVAEPKSGAILALVTLPDFDPSNFRWADPDNFRNRAITDQFEPGSIIKPVIAAIAIDAGSVDRNQTIFCENGSYSGKGFGRIGEYRQGFGDLTVSEILIHSSNIGMAKIGQKTGKETLYSGLKFFGFGKETDIELPGEAQGLLRSPNEWNGYSVTRIPFGQEISVTAVQLVRAFCILANGGHPVRLHLIRAMVDNDGQIVKHDQPVPAIDYIVKSDVAKWIVNEALVGVVNKGTGTRAKLEKWQVFGKTGTAQLAKTSDTTLRSSKASSLRSTSSTSGAMEGGARGYEENAYIASFIAGAPADDPAVVVLVSIRRPNVKLGKGYTGGVVASPVAAKILEKTLTYLENR